MGRSGEGKKKCFGDLKFVIKRIISPDIGDCGILGDIAQVYCVVLVLDFVLVD